MYAENDSDDPSTKNPIAYRYAKNFLDHYEQSGEISASPVETYASAYKGWDISLQESEISNLIAKSPEIRVAWDSLNRIAQDLLREGKPLPPKLAGWAADVLADQLVKKRQEKEKRRPRPVGGAQRKHNRDQIVCILVSQLRCVFDLNATRNDGDPPVSACDVVAAAMDMPYKSAERIWNKRDLDLADFLFSWDKQVLMEGPFYPH